MGFWSSVTSVVKKVVRVVKRVVKAVVRVVVRLITTVVGLALGAFDFLFGFLTWPPKKLRLHIFILSDAGGPLINPGDLTLAIDYARNTLKQRFNVKLLAYGKNMIEIIKEPAPAAALSIGCEWGALQDEFGEAGEYFAQHLAGWNAIPISLTFPITVFVVRAIEGKAGCSLGPLTDYVTLDLDGVTSDSTLVHEIGHACNLLGHVGALSNLQSADRNRGNEVYWWQKNVVRSSRHVMYW
jgi:hypothetical protein